MKIVLTNANLVFTKLRDWTQFDLAYVTANNITGDFQYNDSSQYKRSGYADFISIEEYGKKVAVHIPQTSGIYIYVYDSNENYLGYGFIDNIPDGYTFNDIISAPASYLIGTTQQNKASVVANAASFKVAFATFTSNTGYYVKVR